MPFLLDQFGIIPEMPSRRETQSSVESRPRDEENEPLLMKESKTEINENELLPQIGSWLVQLRGYQTEPKTARDNKGPAL